LVVMADDTADADLVATDLLSQVEHGPGARSILITTRDDLADLVAEKVARAARVSARADALQQSLDGLAAVVVNDRQEALDLVNLIGPEHLEIMMEDFSSLLSKVRNAGAIFLGRDSSVVLGDYAAGSNHILPTGGTTRFSSPLGVRDFIKTSNVIFSNHKANRKLAPVVRELSEAEDLPEHGNSIERRLG
ncbi:MAG: histidinol dehydrogenase, partial [Candidatus Geothermincolia bacterium]